ncbi:MAG: copper oxidase, partial [Thermoanaerobaculia bacterium]|nr:copper oxidase [Thermoanaerobaculia bacterium]
MAGHRPPNPPLDFYDDGTTVHDGGLPRHVIVGGTFFEEHTRLSFEKKLLTAEAITVAPGGERWELEAMKFHADLLPEFPAVRDGKLASYTPEGSPAPFAVNGSDPVAGAPYADPCFQITTPVANRTITYKAANIQLDVVFNKEGWHFPQQRILSLWDDVAGFTGGTKAPEPFFFRANSKDCINFYHTNLVPEIYELDDFQVRTPTDILGQHIHLVKFDVTASDGGANGFNYEDGTLSPGEVVHRIAAINALGGIYDPVSGSKTPLTVKNHPYFNVPGAQTTVQRWYADPTLNMTGNDRTLRTVFTHDHFGPSTHQQVGLYAGLVVEPLGSTWYHNETGVQLGTRHDGGPTSWQAVIEGEKAEDVKREFMFEFSDFQLAYLDGSPTEPDERWGYSDPARAINPPGRHEYWDQLLTGKPWVYEKPAIGGLCPGGVVPPCPEAISSQDPGTFVVNYRNEPVALRVYNPTTGTQAAGLAGDLSHVYRSDVLRANPNFNTQPSTVPVLNEDIKGGDPFTPLLRAYEDDQVQIRILVGGHEEEHNFSVNGVRWPFEISDSNSGFRGSQMMGISEHYEFGIPNLPHNFQGGAADFLWRASTSVDGQWNGLWGLMRAYKSNRGDSPRCRPTPMVKHRRSEL